MRPRLPRSVLLVALVACGDRTAAPLPTAHVTLTEGTVALVGDAPIPAALVARVAAAQRIDPPAALDRLIADALMAQSARSSALDRQPQVAWSLRTAEARILLTRTREDALAAGPPSDAEVAEVTARHWADVDAPELVRVIHAVIVRDDKLKGDEKARQEAHARAVAAELARAELQATSPEDFEARANASPRDGAKTLELRVERLPPIASDTRVADASGGTMDRDFVRAAFALTTPGSTSGVVESQFGWHVIRLIERIPPKRVPLEERRTLFTDEILTARARSALDARSAALRATLPIEIATDAYAALSTIVVPPQ